MIFLDGIELLIPKFQSLEDKPFSSIFFLANEKLNSEKKLQGVSESRFGFCISRAELGDMEISKAFSDTVVR